MDSKAEIESLCDGSVSSAVTSRAAKRQRGRDRRRQGRAEQRMTAASMAVENVVVTPIAVTPSPRALATPLLEPPADVVSCTRIVVKRTFIDVELGESSDEDLGIESPLTSPLDPRNDNAEFDEWRRAYRRFRLGHHKGAKGEATPENMRKRPDLEWLDIGGEAVMWAPVAA